MVSRTKRNEQNRRLRGRVAVETKQATELEDAREVTQASLSKTLEKREKRQMLPDAKDYREYATRGITDYLTHDRALDFHEDEVSFVGDIIVEVSDVKFHKGGFIIMNVQTTDDFMATITDAIRLSRGHPLFCRMYELFPKPESPYADGTHPRDPNPPTPGDAHSFNTPKANK